MNKIFYLLLLFNCIFLYSQEDKEKEKALIESDNLVYEANEEFSADNFVEAEANYRKAISKNAENATAKYNLGNVYYDKDSYGEAFSRFKQAGETAVTKEQKHKAYHNMGNVFMKSKEYDKAVEAYKEALRNNPSDEETRYNLALAKEMLKKQEEEQQKNDQNKDEKEDEKDKKEDKGEDEKDDKGDPKDENEDENKDKGENEDEKKEDKSDQKEDQQKQGDKGDKKEEQNAQQQPRPNQMSPQQVKNMLKAIEDEEKKVQEKVNAQKVKGRPVSTEKDW